MAPSKTQSFPDLIEPWQPFKDMRAITHTALAGVSAECRMEGDTFEMEDQRNWSDASYKTYVRPLALSLALYDPGKRTGLPADHPNDHRQPNRVRRSRRRRKSWHRPSYARHRHRHHACDRPVDHA